MINRCNFKIQDEELESIQEHYKKLLIDKEEELCSKNEELEQQSEELKQQDVIKREEILCLKSKIQQLEEKLKTKIEDVLFLVFINFSIILFKVLIIFFFFFQWT